MHPLNRTHILFASLPAVILVVMVIARWPSIVLALEWANFQVQNKVVKDAKNTDDWS